MITFYIYYLRIKKHKERENNNKKKRFLFCFCFVLEILLVESVGCKPFLQTEFRNRIINEVGSINTLTNTLLITKSLHLINSERLILPPVHQKVLFTSDSVNTIMPNEGEGKDGEDRGTPTTNLLIVDSDVHEIGAARGVHDGEEDGNSTVRTTECTFGVVGLTVGNLEDTFDELWGGGFFFEDPIELAEVGFELSIGLEGSEGTVPVHTDVTHTGEGVNCRCDRHVCVVSFFSSPKK